MMSHCKFHGRYNSDFCAALVVFIIGTRTEVSRLLVVAKTLGMLKGDYAFITLDFFVSESLKTSLEKRTWSLDWEEMLKLFEGLITLSVKKPGPTEIQSLTRWLNTGLQNMPEFQNHTATSLVNKAVTKCDVIIYLAAPRVN